MGVAYQKNVKKNYKIAESEVSKGSVAQMDIRNLMLNIESYEEAVDQGVIDLNTVKTLTTLYPKAIEYFSAFDNNMYNDLLNRMQSLLQREDVQTVLSSVDPAGSEGSPVLKEAAEEEPPLASQAVNAPNKSSNALPQSEPEQKPKIDFNVSEEDVVNH